MGGCVSAPHSAGSPPPRRFNAYAVPSGPLAPPVPLALQQHQQHLKQQQHVVAQQQQQNQHRASVNSGTTTTTTTSERADQCHPLPGSSSNGGAAAAHRHAIIHEEAGYDPDAPLAPQTVPLNWTKGRLIGAGAFGRVFQGLDDDTGQIVAVKQVALTKDEALKGRVAEHVRALEAEVAVLLQLNHRNIVRYLGTERTEETLNIFLEYVPGGSIASLIEKFGPLKPSVIRMYAQQILRGLEYLHAKKIMHRDIKGANILVDGRGTVKLADFGASKKIENLATVGSGSKSIRGTPYWMAPEVIKQTGHGRPADIWSLGCVIIEMATGKPPWSNCHTQVTAMFHIASTKEPPPLPEHLPPEAKDFLLLCFNRVPKDRPNATKLLKHPWMTGSTQQQQHTAAAPAAVPAAGEETPRSAASVQQGPPPPPQQQQQQQQRHPLVPVLPLQRAQGSSGALVPPPSAAAAAAAGTPAAAAPGPEGAASTACGAESSAPAPSKAAGASQHGSLGPLQQGRRPAGGGAAGGALPPLVPGAGARGQQAPLPQQHAAGQREGSAGSFSATGALAPALGAPEARLPPAAPAGLPQHAPVAVGGASPLRGAQLRCSPVPRPAPSMFPAPRAPQQQQQQPASSAGAPPPAPPLLPSTRPALHAEARPAHRHASAAMMSLDYNPMEEPSWMGGAAGKWEARADDTLQCDTASGHAPASARAPAAPAGSGSLQLPGSRPGAVERDLPVRDSKVQDWRDGLLRDMASKRSSTAAGAAGARL